jgi:hypothetical protein
MSEFHCVVASGGAQVPWRDPDGTSAPSRLAFDARTPPTYRSIPGGGTVVVEAVVGGVQAPADSTLGGRLFFVSWGEWSGAAPPTITQPTAGVSAHAVVVFDPVHHLGHHVLTFSRLSADLTTYVNFHVHMDVE